MEITRTVKPIKKTTGLSIWDCAACRVVHMSVGETFVSFDHDEFAQLIEMAVEIQYNGWTRRRGTGSIIDLAIFNGETLH